METQCKLICLLILVLAPLAGRGQPVQLQIVSPSSGLNVQPGQFLDVAIAPIGTSISYFDRGFYLFSTLLAAPVKPYSLDPVKFNIQIPMDAPPGQYTITASGLHANKNAIFSNAIQINLAAPSLLSIVADPGKIVLPFVGASSRVFITGYDSAGETAVTESQISLSSNNANVAIGKSDGRVVATGVGSTTVVVKYLGLVAQVVVSVNSAKIRGDFNGDGVVDIFDLNVINAVLNTAATVVADDRDLNKDGRIDALDLRILTTLCTRPRCATQ